MSTVSQASRYVQEVIGNYRVVRVLGQGGMGTVYLGERIGDFEQHVAIKVLRSGASEHSSEDEILTSLDHPGIVRLLDRGRLAKGADYLVMEYVDGEPLDTYCQRQSADVAVVVQLLLDVANAVAYAHSKLVLHADLKPANILVTRNGEVKLLDFGLARWFTNHHSDRTYFSPGFAPPEQQFGQILTVASDIFSIGRIGEAVASQFLDSAPDLRAIFQKAAAKEPEDRYRGMRELAADLSAWLEMRPVTAYRSGRLYVVQSWARRNRVQASLAAVLALVVAGSAIGVGAETIAAAHRRHTAQSRLREVAALTGKLQGDLYASLPAGERSDLARGELLAATARALSELEQDDKQDPVLRSELALQYRHLAQLQQRRGDVRGSSVSVEAADRLSKPR